jgi:hypothetical protein
MEVRYRELVCRPHSVWSGPPHIDGFFGWRRSGEEWSVVRTAQEANMDALWKQCTVIDERALSLSRWFEARVGSEVVRTQSAASDEVITDA